MKDHHETVKQKKSGYNVIQATDWGSNHKEEFNSSFGTESNKACAIAWKSLSEPDKQKYEEKTSLEEMKEVQFDYIENSRKRHAQAQSDINNIKNTVSLYIYNLLCSLKKLKPILFILDLLYGKKMWIRSSNAYCT